MISSGASSEDVLTFSSQTGHLGQRVDQFVVEHMSEVTRATVQRWIESGRVLLNGNVCRRKDKIRPGAVVEVRPDLPPSTDALPDPTVVLDIIHEDDDLLVVNKPAGLVVHPGRGHRSGTMVNGLLARPGFERAAGDPRDPEGQLRPGIVHRIDKDTSGLLVVAKNAQAREGLKEQLAEHSVERLYRALTVGTTPSRTLKTLHGRDPKSRLKFSSRVLRGKEAITHVECIESLADGNATLVQCRLETGRTHQIRVHLSQELGTPILADSLYGGMRGAPHVLATAQLLGRQALHAAVLGFVHPISKAFLRFESPLPDDMANALRALQSQEGPEA